MFIINNYVPICVILLETCLGLLSFGFFWNQWVITANSLGKTLISFETFSAKVDNVLSSAKLFTDAINMKRNKWFIDRLNKRGPSIKPLWTPVITISNSL